MNKMLLFLLNFSVKMLVISFETPKDLNSHFAKCRRAFFGITGGAPCEKYCTDGKMNMKVYQQLLH